MENASISDRHYDLDALLEAQRAYFRKGSTRPVEFRQERLRGFADQLEKRADDLLETLASDLGKPGLEAYVSEVWFTLEETRLFAKQLAKWAKPKRAGNPFFYWPARSETRREPFGNSLIVGPWNYPIQLSLSPLVASIGAGNTVVLKPSELAPASSSLLAEIIAECFNPHHVAVVEGGMEVGQRLMEHPFDAWFFTGSERVGKLYAEAAARHLAPITLELGGKCPAIVLEDAPLAPTVERIVATKFFNAGQTCIAPDFVAVPEERRKELVEAIVAELKSAYENNADDLACVINDSHFDRLESLLTDDSIQIGENERDNRFFAPTVIPSAHWSDPAMKDEIFGPILPVIGYRDLDAIVEQLSERPSPLALYLFSKNKTLSEAVAAEIPSGSLCFNDAVKQATNLELPFGGVGASGMGRYRGRHGFETFTYARAVTRRGFFKDPFLTKPPYGDALERLRKILK